MEFPRRNEYYYNNYFHLSDVRDEAINNNIHLSLSQLNQLSQPQLDKYLNGKSLSDFLFYKYTFISSTKDLNYIIENLIEKGYTNIVKYLDKSLITSRAALYAAKYGRLDLIKHFVNNEYPINGLAVEYAIRGSNWETLNFLLENNAPIFEDAISIAISQGDIDIAKRLIDKGVGFDEEAVINAIYKGDLDLVKLSIKKGAPIGNRAMEAAAMCGYLDIIKLLIDKGVPVSWRTVIRAAVEGEREIMKYLLSLDQLEATDEFNYIMFDPP